MINITRCCRDPRLLKAVTGLTTAEFTALVPAFAAAVTQTPLATPRHRQVGGGRTHPLPPCREKLFLILFDVKCYATYDVLAWLFDVERAHTHRGMAAYCPLVEKALGRKAVVPERTIARGDALLRQCPPLKEVVVDGTERPIRRPSRPPQNIGKAPQNTGDPQKTYDSGKKKGHRVKNIVLTTFTKRICLLSDTLPGRVPDTTGATDAGVVSSMPPDVLVPLDWAL